MRKSFLITALALIIAICSCGLFACSGANTGKGKDPGVYYKKYTGDDYYTVYDYVAKDGETELDLTDPDVIPADVEIGRIQAGAFDGNSNLKKLIVPDTVEIIDEGAFAGMRNLEELTVPFIGRTANADSFFGETDGATDKSVDDERTLGYMFGTSAFNGGVTTTQQYDGVSGTRTYYFPSKLKTVTVKPSSDDYNIPMYAFSGNQVITTVNLSDKVDAIGEGAFKDCIRLKTVSGTDKVVSIYDSAFSGCGKLTSEIESSVLTLVGNNAYENSGLTTATIKAGVSYGSRVFKDSKVQSVTVNANVPIYCFYGCTELTMVTVNSAVTFNAYSFAKLGDEECTFSGSTPTLNGMWNSGSTTKFN